MSGAVAHWPRLERKSWGAYAGSWFWWCVQHGTCAGGYRSRVAARRAADEFCGGNPPAPPSPSTNSPEEPEDA